MVNSSPMHVMGVVEDLKLVKKNNLQALFLFNDLALTSWDVTCGKECNSRENGSLVEEEEIFLNDHVSRTE